MIPITRIIGLLSLALLGGGVYVFWAWYVGVLVGTACPVWGLVSTPWTLLGHRIILLLIRRSGRDDPQATREDAVRGSTRPVGTELRVQTYGPPTGRRSSSPPISTAPSCRRPANG